MSEFIVVSVYGHSRAWISSEPLGGATTEGCGSSCRTDEKLLLSEAEVPSCPGGDDEFRVALAV